MDKENGELVFLRYAFPVIGYCSKGTITAGEILEFEETLKSEGQPNRQRLTEVFPNAVESMRKYANGHALSGPWNPENVRAYWLDKKGHNKVVGDNVLCSVYLCSVSEVFKPRNNEICRVNLNRMSGLEVASYIPLVKDDKVAIHGFQVAEKLSSEALHRFFGK